ncbi:hypothetical protein [Bradyrhizobium cenepequi]|uniref:hypothetical protein n=1 Tax=Bradyrhizobium cenepequi TaxID=2821403 RepID=UPI001CE28054|nr:hypothetical protein [Bradyrhizobium cenepequi]MCA6112910.1 hypothetical protein [Bradyrhizobium cenepequi]
MGQIVAFASKSERERVRLIREARAIYDSIFPPGDAIGDRPVSDPARLIQPDWMGPAPSKETSGG